MAPCSTVTQEPTEAPETPYRTVVGDGVPDLDGRLSDELDKVNAATTAGVAPSRELDECTSSAPGAGTSFHRRISR